MLQQDESEISRCYLGMHITAIKIIKHLLFIAEGNQVSVFNYTTKKRILIEVIFSGSTVHGIRTDENKKILFFGSKSLKVYSFDFVSDLSLKSYSEELFLFDWIFDVKWLNYPDETEDIIAIITAHNSLTLFNIKNKEKLTTVHCTENCILYAANIISTLENSIVIAVGTVFKQILLWSPNSVNGTYKAKSPFHCLDGHKGVIFSINYSKHQKLLSSTSDDRSIRLWKVNFESDDDGSLECWEKVDITPSHVLYAHESRVWISAILEECIVSVGEDSCICFWNMTGDLIKRKKCHKGGSIWCLETSHLELNYCDSKNSRTPVAFTGGSDGGVYCWDLQAIMSKSSFSEISLHVRPLSNKDFPRVVFIMDCDSNRKLMTTTDQGYLSFYDMNTASWKDIFYDSSYVSYCLSSVSRKKSFLALGNLNGDIMLKNFRDSLSVEDKFQKFHAHSGKLFALHWIDQDGEHLLSCGAEGFMIMWEIHFHDNEFSLNKKRELHLPKCKPHWWSTCAVLISPFLIVGDRGGNISFYSLDSEHREILESEMIHKGIHGENGVTDIQEHKSLIYSAGRDGRILLYKINHNSLDFLHAVKIAHELEWIGKMLFCGSDLLLVGFYTKYFIVWSTALESTVMTVECGGGHRSWDFHLSSNYEATFVAIKKKNIMFCSENLNSLLNKSIIKGGVSGKEFCQTCYLFTQVSDKLESMAVCAAGGEDNALQIIGFFNNSKFSEMKVLHSLAGHLSSIRSLAKTSMKEKDTFLLASVGGRAQMMLWKIKNNSDTECELLASYILSACEKRNKKPTKGIPDTKVDPETRLMDVNITLNCSDNKKDNYIIAVACSDSYFRLYSFDAHEKSISLYYNVQLGDYCILKVNSIQNFLAFKDVLFITSTTKGYLNFIYHENIGDICLSQLSDLKPKCQIQVHQSGINAVDMIKVCGDTWLICTGGDDNALTATVIQAHSLLSDCKIVAKTEVCSAHSSQITGIKILDNNTLLSVSIDQRINLWKWHFDQNSLILTLKNSKISSIPDIAGLECWKTGNTWMALVCGEGLEIFSISKEN